MIVLPWGVNLLIVQVINIRSISFKPFFILIQRVDSKVNARLPFLKWAYYYDLLVERVNFLY